MAHLVLGELAVAQTVLDEPPRRDMQVIGGGEHKCLGYFGGQK